MNTSVTSRDAILSVSRQFITQNGFGSVNMRAIAAACGVSVGSVYNYFPSKGDLICAVVESVWHDIFHLSGQSSQFSSFPDCVKWLFDSIRQGCEEYPAFFTLHSLSFSSSEKQKGREMMERSFAHIRASMLRVLQNDPNVRKDAFDGELGREEFVQMVFTLITTALLEDKQDCRALLVLVRRYLYQ